MHRFCGVVNITSLSLFFPVVSSVLLPVASLWYFRESLPSRLYSLVLLCSSVFPAGCRLQKLGPPHDHSTTPVAASLWHIRCFAPELFEFPLIHVICAITSKKRHSRGRFLAYFLICSVLYSTPVVNSKIIFLPGSPSYVVYSVRFHSVSSFRSV
jgi:hypothetical protein